VFKNPRLTVESFLPFVGHPTLRAATVATGTKSRDAEIGAMLKLPAASFVPVGD